MTMSVCERIKYNISLQISNLYVTRNTAGCRGRERKDTHTHHLSNTGVELCFSNNNLSVKGRTVRSTGWDVSHTLEYQRFWTNFLFALRQFFLRLKP